MNTSVTTKLLILLLLSLATACVYGEKPNQPKSNRLPILILDGLYLGELLGVPEKLDTPAALQAALTKDWYGAISVSNSNNRGVDELVKNCRDYFDALKAGKQPTREYERSTYMEFGLMCMAARDTAEAKPAASSYIKDLVLDKVKPAKLPKQIAMLTSEAEYRKMLDDTSKVYWADVNRIKNVDIIDDYRAIYKHHGAQQEIALVAKGDFNNDGVEDVLLTSKDSVVGGSYSGMRMFLLTKYATESAYTLLKEYRPI